MDHSQVGGEGVVVDDYLRLLVHLDDDEGQGLVVLILAPTKEDSPEFLSVDGVICFLEVDEGCVVTPLLALLGGSGLVALTYEWPLRCPP